MNPETLMRARMLGIEVDCGECVHWITQGMPWCRKHRVHGHAPGAYADEEAGIDYCNDFELPTQ